MVHYSKKDSWLIGFILAGSIIPLALGLFFLLAGGPNRNAGYLLLVIGVMEVVVILILTYPLYYEVTTSELIVRCGVLMNRHIPLGAIDEVQPDRNAVSSPAWSLDRLRIDYRKNELGSYPSNTKNKLKITSNEIKILVGIAFFVSDASNEAVKMFPT